MNKKLNLSMLILSLFILISSLLLSKAIKSTHVDTKDPRYVNINSVDHGYELMVDNGWLYLHDKSTGQIYKKLDDDEAKWEAIEHYSTQVE